MSESYTFRFNGKSIEVMVMLDDNNKRTSVQVLGPISGLEKKCFNSYCKCINSLVGDGIFKATIHKSALLKVSQYDAKIYRFFETNIFSLLGIE